MSQNLLSYVATIDPVVASIAATAPSIDVAEARRSLVDRSTAMRIVDMYLDEALELLRKLDIVPLGIDKAREVAYAICGTSAVELGSFGIEIPQHSLRNEICTDLVGYIHTHPVPLPIPTPEDAVSSYQLRSRVECIATKVDGHGIATCIEVDDVGAWMEVTKVVEDMSEKVVESPRYVVVGDDNGIFLLPYPDKSFAIELTREFVRRMRAVARTRMIVVDIEKSVYEISEE